MKHQLPALEYSYESLEPYIDGETMKIHHTKHHQNYVNKLNDALESYPDLQEKTVEELLKNIKNLPNEIKTAIINNGGGHINHDFFWKILKKEIPFNPKSEIGKSIIKKFKSYENFEKEFSNAAIGVFGSGWAWLVFNENKELEIIKTQNQDSPLSLGKIPILCIDVWEHAYYLKYQNKRAEYIENFFKIINWKKVEENYKKMKK